MPKSRQGGAHTGSKVTICGKPKENNTRRPNAGVRSELRCRSGGAEFVVLGFSCHLVLSALGLH